MSVLELCDVSRVYGNGPAEVHALRDVWLTVDEGELVAVMGPSGSGKSTLLSIAGTLEEPTKGQVIVGGAPVCGMSRNDRARLRRRSIGYVFQDFNLLAGLTAAENVSLPLELDGVPGKSAGNLQRRILQNHMDLLATPRQSDKEEAERLRSRELVAEIEDNWSGLIAEGIEAGAFADRDPRMQARLVLALVISVWRWYRPNGSLTLEQITETVADAAVRIVRN